MAWEEATTLTLVGLMLLAMVFEIAPADVLIMSVVVISALPFQIISVSEAVSGFSNEGMLTVATLFIVAAGVEFTGGIDPIKRLLRFRAAGLPTNSLVLRIMLPIMVLSAFLNNTPVVAMMIPVLERLAGDINVPRSKLLMPLSYASMLGGTCTLIGTSTNLIVLGLAQDRFPDYNMGIFDIGQVGLPVGLAGVLYCALAADRLLPTSINPLDPAGVAGSLDADAHLSKTNAFTRGRWRATLAGLLAVTMVSCSVAGLPLLLCAMWVALLLCYSGCLTATEARGSIDLQVVIVVAGAFGINNALVNSGAADTIADALVAAARPGGLPALYAAVYGMTVVISAMVTNNAAVTVMFPIAMEAAEDFEIEDISPMLYVLMMGSSASYMTHIGYQTNMMVMDPGAYRLLDFLRYGVPLQLVCGSVTMGVILTLEHWYVWAAGFAVITLSALLAGELRGRQRQSNPEQDHLVEGLAMNQTKAAPS